MMTSIKNQKEVPGWHKPETRLNCLLGPRSLERSSNDLLELRRLQAMRSPPPNNVLSRLGNPAGKLISVFFKKATKI